MTTLEAIDTKVQELRVEPQQGGFTHTLGQVVGALGAIPDLPPDQLTADEMARLRELADETVEAVERRIASGGDGDDVQMHLAGTVYEVRRRMEAIERWFTRREPA